MSTMRSLKMVHVLGLFFIFITISHAYVFSGLVSGTKIMTIKNPVPIEDLVVGNKIMGYNRIDDSFPEVTIEKICTEEIKGTYVIATDKGEIYASGDQLFYEITIDDFIKAEQLKVGNILQTKDLKECLCISIEKKNTQTMVYDIILQEPHLFFSSDAQVLTHNPVAFILTFPWVTQAIVAIAGFCVGAVCLYNEKPTGIISKLDKIEEKIKNDMSDWCSKYYNGKSKLAPENYKERVSVPYKDPAKGGVSLDVNLCQNLVTYPLRYGSLYPIAFMTNTGSVACIVLAPKFTRWGIDGTNYWELIEFGRNIFPRVHPFVKAFVEAEDKMQLDNLQAAVKKWPSTLITKLFKSKVTAKEKKSLRIQNSSLDQIIYGITFGLDAIYHMLEKKFAPSLVLQTIQYGGRGILCNPDLMMYFDAKQDIAVLVEKKSKKIINVGHYSTDLSSLNEAQSEDSKEKNKEDAKDKANKPNADKIKIVVDSNGNAIPLKPGQTIEGSPDGTIWQVKDVNGNPTGERYDGKGHPKQNDPKAQKPHAHRIDENGKPVLDETGNPHLPVNVSKK